MCERLLVLISYLIPFIQFKNVSAPPVTVRNAAIKYLETVEAGTVAHDCDPWAAVKANKSFDALQSLLERVLSVPATSAPVECIFSQSSLIMKLNRVRLGKKLLCKLVFLKCNINV